MRALSRPLLLLDVDGVLNPFPDTPTGYREYRFFPEDVEPVRLCAAHAGWLRELGEVFKIVWATGWGEAANRLICPALRLPAYAVVPMPELPFAPALKVPAIDRFAGDPAAAWVDDAVTSEAVAWAAARPVPTLLVEIDPAVGLGRGEVERLLAWALRLRQER